MNFSGLSNRSIWFEAIIEPVTMQSAVKFDDCLLARVYPARAIDTTFRSFLGTNEAIVRFCWRLEAKFASKVDRKFNRCVFSSTNASGISLLQERMDLLLQKLLADAEDCDIFLSLAFFAQNDCGSISNIGFNRAAEEGLPWLVDMFLLPHDPSDAWQFHAAQPTDTATVPHKSFQALESI